MQSGDLKYNKSMSSSYSFSAYARNRFGGPNADIQRLIEAPNTTLEELLKVPNVVIELQGPIDCRNFFNTQRIEQLVQLVFDPDSVAKIPFEEARRITFAASEILTMKIPSVNDFFFHTSNDQKLKKSAVASEDVDVEVDVDFGAKEILLSPVNSVKSKSTTTVESYNKSALDYLLAKAFERPQIDDTRAGYLNKILVSFFHKYKNEFLSYFFKSGFDYKILADYLESFSIADLISSITFFETSMGNDSIVFHDSRVQANNDHPKARLELLRAVFTSPLIPKSKEAAANFRFIVEEFFSKYKSINEADLFFFELFSNDKVLRLWLNYLIDSANHEVEAHLMAVFKNIAKFIFAVSNSKTEILNDACKGLFATGKFIAVEFPLILSDILDLFIEKPIRKSMSTSQRWINTFKTSSDNNTKSKIYFLEFAFYCMKQKFLPLEKSFTTSSFLAFLLVA